MDSDADIIGWIEDAALLSEVARSTFFTGWRKYQLITVEIRDRGPDAPPQSRYSVEATTKDGGRITGNAADSIWAALSTVPWSELDRP